MTSAIESDHGVAILILILILSWNGEVGSEIWFGFLTPFHRLWQILAPLKILREGKQTLKTGTHDDEGYSLELLYRV